MILSPTHSVGGKQNAVVAISERSTNHSQGYDRGAFFFDFDWLSFSDPSFMFDNCRT